MTLAVIVMVHRGHLKAGETGTLTHHKRTGWCLSLRYLFNKYTMSEPKYRHFASKYIFFSRLRSRSSVRMMSSGVCGVSVEWGDLMCVQYSPGGSRSSAVAEWRRTGEMFPVRAGGKKYTEMMMRRLCLRV